jgi:hypothetical protein
VPFPPSPPPVHPDVWHTFRQPFDNGSNCNATFQARPIWIAGATLKRFAAQLHYPYVSAVALDADSIPEPHASRSASVPTPEAHPGPPSRKTPGMRPSPRAGKKGEGQEDLGQAGGSKAWVNKCITNQSTET